MLTYKGSDETQVYAHTLLSHAIAALTLIECIRSSRAIWEVSVRRFLVTVSNSAARVGLVRSTSAGRVGRGNSPEEQGHCSQFQCCYRHACWHERVSNCVSIIRPGQLQSSQADAKKQHLDLLCAAGPLCDHATTSSIATTAADRYRQHASARNPQSYQNV